MAGFSDATVTIGLLVALAGGVFGVIRWLDWLNAKVASAVTPVTEKLKAAEEKVDRLQSKLNEMEVNVVRNYVPNAAMMHLEVRMDQGFQGIHEEMGKLRDMLIRQLAARNEPART